MHNKHSPKFLVGDLSVVVLKETKSDYIVLKKENNFGSIEDALMHTAKNLEFSENKHEFCISFYV